MPPVEEWLHVVNRKAVPPLRHLSWPALPDNQDKEQRGIREEHVVQNVSEVEAHMLDCVWVITRLILFRVDNVSQTSASPIMISYTV